MVGQVESASPSMSNSCQSSMSKQLPVLVVNGFVADLTNKNFGLLGDEPRPATPKTSVRAPYSPKEVDAFHPSHPSRQSRGHLARGRWSPAMTPAGHVDPCGRSGRGGTSEVAKRDQVQSWAKSQVRTHATMVPGTISPEGLHGRLFDVSERADFLPPPF